MRVRDPAEELSGRDERSAAGGVAPLLAALRAWPSLLRGALLSGLIHGTILGLILFGLPILYLNLTDDAETASDSLRVVMVAPQATPPVAPSDDDASAESGTAQAAADIRREGTRYLADTPASEKTPTEKGDVPTTRGDGDPQQEADATPEPRRELDDDAQKRRDADATPPATAQTARASVEPPPAPQANPPPQTTTPQAARDESRPAGPTVLVVDGTPPASKPTSTAANQAAIAPPTQAVAAAEASPPQSSATPLQAGAAPTAPVRSPPPAAAARNAQAAASEASASQQPPAAASGAQPAATATGATAEAVSGRGDVLLAQPTPQATAALPPPAAPTTVAPKAPPKTPGDVVDRLAEALPRIASIRAEIKEAAARPPGTVIPAEDQAQVERLEKFADQGYAHAQFALAEMLLTGVGLPRDPAQGKEIAVKAALNGYLPAQILLGALAADGSMEQPRDLGEAHAWWTLAAGNGSRPAAEAVKAIEPMLEVKDVVRSRQKLGELRQVSVLLSPQANRKLTSKQAGDKLREAAALGDLETVTVMLTQGADADSSDEDGRTALIEAAWRGYANIIATLIRQGANLGQSDASGKSPLAWAAINGHVAVSRLLLDAGQNPDVPDDEGITPLMRAAWNNRPDVVRLLLEKGANPSLRDKKGLTALDYAVRDGDPRVLALLRGVTR